MLPLDKNLFNMLGITAAYRQGVRAYVLPLDLSQMHVPYKTYKRVADIAN
jgi:hypothetical protein